MTPAEAVLALRNALSELEGKRVSQQEFSNRLGVAVRSVAGYESGANPTGRVLVSLTQLARKHGQHHLANVFWRAFLQDTGLSRERVHFYGFKDEPGTLPHYYFFSYTPPDADKRERAAVWAFSDALLEAYSTDPETKERGLQKLAAATKALTVAGKRGKGRQG